jgi:hypothetical protein
MRSESGKVASSFRHLGHASTRRLEQPWRIRRRGRRAPVALALVGGPPAAGQTGVGAAREAATRSGVAPVSRAAALGVGADRISPAGGTVGVPVRRAAAFQ